MDGTSQPTLVERAFQHVRGLWPGPGLWLPLPFVLWGLACLAIGAARWEHALFVVAVPALAYGGAASRRLFVGLLPFGILGLVYDAMRWVKDLGVTPERVHVCDLRAIDMSIVSVTVGGERVSVHDLAQAHSSLALDLVAAVPYGTFIYVAVAFALYLYAKDEARMRLFGWTFLLVNLAGFTTYHLYPAAPPWYFHAHGCTVDLAAPASEGPNLARVDALLGVQYFRGFYARSADVFGAVPSLHVAYPTLILLFGWPILRWPGRTFAVVFLVWMCAAAVYLDHHWVIDVILGFAYATSISVAVMIVARARRTRDAHPPPISPELAP